GDTRIPEFMREVRLTHTRRGYRLKSVRDTSSFVPDPHRRKEPTMAANTKDYTVEGMTCGHCEMSVKEEVGEISGVTGVEASHETGKVSVSGENFTDEQVAAAVEEAGYTLKAYNTPPARPRHSWRGRATLFPSHTAEHPSLPHTPRGYTMRIEASLTVHVRIHRTR